nr:uncharacterized protein CTRU02_03120 [Colletotrichum truncatum]KAF6797088.1 hypothetical protein CTRU02_03120 [Colletotrichum truncatum]
MFQGKVVGHGSPSSHDSTIESAGKKAPGHYRPNRPSKGYSYARSSRSDETYQNDSLSADAVSSNTPQRRRYNLCSCKHALGYAHVACYIRGRQARLQMLNMQDIEIRVRRTSTAQVRRYVRHINGQKPGGALSIPRE